MNFLAHQYLSFDRVPLMVGNFLADTVRGSDFTNYGASVRQGILLHREIDTFTDTHPFVLETRKLLYSHFSKYAAVVQDVFYDHFLAIGWGQYYPGQSLPAFAKRVYATLNEHRNVMNERALRTLYFMEQHGWLQHYALKEGIDRSLKGLSHRASFQSNMENGLLALEAYFDEMKVHFDAFFPELENHSRRWISENIGD